MRGGATMMMNPDMLNEHKTRTTTRTSLTTRESENLPRPTPGNRFPKLVGVSGGGPRPTVVLAGLTQIDRRDA